MITLDFADNGVVSIRRETEEDGVHREARAPGADLTDLPPDIRAEIEAVWTPAKIAAFMAAHPADPEPDVDLTAYAARRRWEIETGGATLLGVTVSTDDRAKLMLAGARARAEADPAFTTRFKAASGWVSLDAASVIALSDAVADFVNRLFAAEDEIAAAIASGEIATTAAIDAALEATAAG